MAQTSQIKMPKGILQRGDKFRVQAVYKGHRKTGTANSLAEAIILKEALVKELSEGTHEAKAKPKTSTISTSWTFKEAVEKTHAIVWAGKGGESSSMINAHTLMDYFGAATLLEDITLEQIDTFITHCINDKGNSGATVNRKMACLSRILRTAHERGKIPVLLKMPRRSEGEHRIRFLTKEEEDKLKEVIEQVVSQDIADAVLMLLYTGFRCGELWRLECRDIDLVQGTLTAWKTKNKHPRTIPIVDTIRPVIERRIREVNGSGRIFPKGSTVWLRRPWDVIRYHMGMSDDPQFIPHMLRHTCATRLSQAGVTMPIIKEWMGHTTITTTARYAHFSPKDLHNAAKLLGNR